MELSLVCRHRSCRLLRSRRVHSYCCFSAPSFGHAVTMQFQWSFLWIIWFCAYSAQDVIKRQYKSEYFTSHCPWNVHLCFYDMLLACLAGLFTSLFIAAELQKTNNQKNPLIWSWTWNMNKSEKRAASRHGGVNHVNDRITEQRPLKVKIENQLVCLLPLLTQWGTFLMKEPRSGDTEASL